MAVTNSEFDFSDLITLLTATKLLPSRPHRSTLHRWGTKGVAINGERLKLRTVRLGGTLYTTAQWLRVFAVEASAHGEISTPKIQRRQLNERHEADEATLQSAGV